MRSEYLLLLCHREWFLWAADPPGTAGEKLLLRLCLWEEAPELRVCAAGGPIKRKDRAAANTAGVRVRQLLQSSVTHAERKREGREKERERERDWSCLQIIISSKCNQGTDDAPPPLPQTDCHWSIIRHKWLILTITQILFYSFYTMLLRHFIF